MELELRQAKQKLDQIGLREGQQLCPKVRQLQREMWVLEGALTRNLKHDLLLVVAKKYEKIGCVPVDYFYPEFYATPGLKPISKTTFNSYDNQVNTKLI